MDENAKELQKREERLFTDKEPYDALNQELALNFYPERADFIGERAIGAEYAIDLFNSAPILNRRDLGNARASMIRPRGLQWYRAGTPDDELNKRGDIARALDWINQRSRSLMYRALTGFVRCQKEADQDLVTFGNSVQTVESVLPKRGEERRLLYTDWHLRDCAWLDDADGTRQDFMARRFMASARHIKQKFPDAELHEDIKKALDRDAGNDPDKKFQLCHVMMLAEEYEYYKKPNRKAEYVSVYYDSDHKMLLRERPSEHFRYVVSKWQTISGRQYAISPAALAALPDARAMQAMARIFEEAGEKALDPPIKATRGAVEGEINGHSGGVTWVDKEYDERMGPAIEHLLPGNVNHAIGIDMLNRITFALREAWFLTNLKLPQQAKTAYETAQLVEEFIRANIPLFEPWEADTELMLSETFAVLLDMEALGPLGDWPPELLGGELEFRFSNPLQDAIEKNKVNQANIAFGLIAGGEQVDPGVGKRVVDIGKVVQDGIRGSGSPAEWLIDEEEAKRAGQATQQAGDILTALSGAQQAAEVVDTGLGAAQKLQQLNQAAADGGGVYGPS